MVDCLSCGADSGRIAEISNVEYTPNVLPGGMFSIKVTSKVNILFGTDYLRVCLFREGEHIANSKSVPVRQGEVFEYTFTGIMPDTNVLYFKVSLQMEALGFMESCQDARDVIIRKTAPGYTPPPEIETVDTDAAPTIHTDDTGEVIDVSTDDEDEKTLWEWLFGIKEDAKEGADALDWFMDNVVLILILVLIIILVLKFG